MYTITVKKLIVKDKVLPGQQNDVPLCSWIIICPICNNNNSNKTVTDPECGEIICSNCGVVISETQEAKTPEWRTFNTIELNDRTRIGNPTTLARHDMGLATIIGRSSRDASGQKLAPATQSTMNRLRIMDYRTQSHTPTDMNRKRAFNELDKLKDKLGLTDAAVEKTAYLYRKVQKRGLVRGRSISSVLAAAAYITCREIGISRTIKDIATISDVRWKELARIYRILV